MNKLYSNIKARRIELGMSQEQLASLIGYTDKSSVSKIEAGKTDLPLSKLEIFADALRTTVAALQGNAEKSIPQGCEPVPRMVKIPLISSVASGTAVLDKGNVEDYVGVPAMWRADFALRCRGDSMAPTVQNGDIVCIRSQPEVENGEVAAVRIDEEATLKRVYVYSGYIELRPENPAYQSIIKIGEEMNDVHIEGKAIGLCRGL